MRTYGWFSSLKKLLPWLKTWHEILTAKKHSNMCLISWKLTLFFQKNVWFWKRNILGMNSKKFSCGFVYCLVKTHIVSESLQNFALQFLDQETIKIIRIYCDAMNPNVHYVHWIGATAHQWVFITRKLNMISTYCQKHYLWWSWHVAKILRHSMCANKRYRNVSKIALLKVCKYHLP